MPTPEKRLHIGECGIISSQIRSQKAWNSYSCLKSVHNLLPLYIHTIETLYALQEVISNNRRVVVCCAYFQPHESSRITRMCYDDATDTGYWYLPVDASMYSKAVGLQFIIPICMPYKIRALSKRLI